MLVLANSLCLLVEIKKITMTTRRTQGGKLQKHVVQWVSGLGFSRWKMAILSPGIVFTYYYSASKAEIC